MSKIYFIYLILFVLISCDTSNDEMFGGTSDSQTGNDLFGCSRKKVPPVKVKESVKIPVIEDKTIEDITIEDKTIGEKLLDVSVSINVFDSKGNPLKYGSGVFIKSNLIVTNVHVIEGGTSFIAKRNSDGKEFALEVYKLDISHDVAILLTKNFNSPKFLKINSKFPRIGNEIWVAGTPMGQEGTISNGIISSIEKVKNFDYDLLQFTAPISSGSSGGPLVNNNLELIGITVLTIKENAAQNINFAVPAKYILNLLDEENN